MAETNVRVSHSLSTGELRDAIYEETDFLHFVGHVTDSGMVCPDGALDTRTLAGTDVNAFFLNGCRSYDQGRALLTAGSVGGIVTVDDVPDDDAGRVGTAVSLLLDAGFPLYAILDVLSLTSVQQNRYAILGSGTFAVRRAASSTPGIYAFESGTAGPESVPLTVRYYPYDENGMGTLTVRGIIDDDPLVGNAATQRHRVARSTLSEYLDTWHEPLLLDGTVRYTADLTVADFE